MNMHGGGANTHDEITPIHFSLFALASSTRWKLYLQVFSRWALGCSVSEEIVITLPHCFL